MRQTWPRLGFNRETAAVLRPKAKPFYVLESHRKPTLKLYKRCLQLSNAFKTVDVQLSESLFSYVKKDFRRYQHLVGATKTAQLLDYCHHWRRKAESFAHGHTDDLEPFKTLVQPKVPFEPQTNFALRPKSNRTFRYLRKLQNDLPWLGVPEITLENFRKMPERAIQSLLKALESSREQGTQSKALECLLPRRRSTTTNREKPNTDLDLLSLPPEQAEVERLVRRRDRMVRPYYVYELQFSSGTWFVRNKHDKHNNALGTMIKKKTQLLERKTARLQEGAYLHLLSKHEDVFEQMIDSTLDGDNSPIFSNQNDWSAWSRRYLIALKILHRLRQQREIERGQRLAKFVKNHMIEIDEKTKQYEKRREELNRDIRVRKRALEKPGLDRDPSAPGK